jgi:PIN like domain
VRLFFDEDRGKGVAIALHAVGIPAFYVGPKMPVEKQTPDEVWIPRAGRTGWLVISANKAILQAYAQRELWIEHKVGGVFLTTNRLNKLTELKLLLRKLDWLERIDREESRPFAFLLSPRGDIKRAPEIPLS